jgi:serine/threonine-protein kinase HipA
VPKTLDVYLREDLVGHFVQDDHGDVAFGYAASWLENAAAIPLSQSLPLRQERFSRKECRGFFAGVLPEQSMREIIARILGISAKNDFKMLEQSKSAVNAREP